MKKRLIVTLLGVAAMAAASADVCQAAGNAYLSVQGGVFLPNGKGSIASVETNKSADQGLKDFDSGYNLGVAVGFRPETYAAIEIGTGVFGTSGERNDSTAVVTRQKFTGYGVPITVTAKGILNFGKTDLYAGAGIGYYFAVLDYEKDSKITNGVESKSQSSHGNALGYHLCGGVDYNFTESFALGAEVKWFSTKPEFDVNSDGTKTKWEFGGTTLNLGVKYKF